MAKIYTGSGDKGSSGLVGGQRVPKHHIRLEAYGTIDELNSFVGLLQAQLKDEEIIKILYKIQHKLFDVGAYLATEPQDLEKHNISTCTEEDIKEIENYIDKLSSKLKPLKQFILPGGNTIVAYCHILRTVCRRGERRITLLAQESEVDIMIIKYINRLSDLFFIMARKLSQDFFVLENKWKFND